MIMTGLRPTGHKLKNHAARICLQREFAFRSYLRLRYGAKTPVKVPKISFENGALRNRDEWLAATRLVRDLRLVPHPDSPKNWDTVAALATILKSTNPDAWVLDAGAELSSALLPCLYLYGYRNLTGINLIFQKPQRRGSIAYEFGDITNTRFHSEQFDAITCLSVIEHGVDLQAYFREMSRIPRPGGLLITSTDYFDNPIETHGTTAYGAPVHIFFRAEIIDAISIAESVNLRLTGPLSLDSVEKPVRWERFGLDFTFLLFTLQKIPRIKQ